jgi:hypothetical protein
MLGWLASFTRSRPLVCGEISEVADERFELGIIHDGLARFIALPDCLPHCADFLAGRRRVDGDDIKATRALEQNFVNPLVSITHLVRETFWIQAMSTRTERSATPPRQRPYTQAAAPSRHLNPIGGSAIKWHEAYLLRRKNRLCTTQ